MSHTLNHKFKNVMGNNNLKNLLILTIRLKPSKWLIKTLTKCQKITSKPSIVSKLPQKLLNLDHLLPTIAMKATKLTKIP